MLLQILRWHLQKQQLLFYHTYYYSIFRNVYQLTTPYLIDDLSDLRDCPTKMADLPKCSISIFPIVIDNSQAQCQLAPTLNPQPWH